MAFSAVLATNEALAREWCGIEAANRIGGRMTSAGYMRGKVVLFDSRDYSAASEAENIRALQAVWNAYKTKSFVLIGNHTGGGDAEAVRKAMAKLGVTYPVYKNVSIDDGAADGAEPVAVSGTMMVFDATFTRLIYIGSLVNEARGIVGNAIFAARKPNNVKNWKALLDYEIQFLPGQAYLRLKELMDDDETFLRLKAKLPEDARRYEAEWKKAAADDKRKKLAELVSISREIRDRDTAAAKWRRLTPRQLDSIAEKYSFLKSDADANAAQEAKNALADLMFAKASLEKRAKKR